MERLFYISTASAGVDGGDVFDIIQTASVRNPQRDITGFLVFARGKFFQYIEGDTAALDRLLEELLRDRRHHQVRVLDRRPAAARAFPGWRMRRLSVSEQSGAPEALLDQLRKLGMAAEAVAEVERCLAVRTC